MSGTRPSSEHATEVARYQLPRPAGTVWLGIRLSSLLLLATSIACAIGLVLADAPAPAAVGLLLLSAVISLVPVADRPTLHWIGPAVRHHLRRSQLTWSASDMKAALPPECGRVRLVRLNAPEPPRAPGVGLLVHGSRSNSIVPNLQQPPARSAPSSPSPLPRGARTVVLEVSGGDGFGLLDPTSQDTTLAGWGGALDALAADSRVLRVQWVTHTRPAVAPPPGPAAPDDQSRDLTRDLTQDYDELVSFVAGQAWTHTHLLAITLRPDASRGRRRRGDDAEPQPASHDLGLMEQVRDVTALLLTADVLARPLHLAELGDVLRLLTEPDHDPALHGVPTASEGRQGSDPQQWGVRCRRSEWTAVRTGDAWHRSYAVANWPNLPLPADWLSGLLGSTPPDGTSRTLSVHARPIAPVHATRQARAAAAKVQLDAADRSRFGLTGAPGGATPLDDQRATDAAALETELAAGYRMHHTRAVITISATSQLRLQQAGSALRATAATHRLDLRPLHGQHHLGLAATLPLTLAPGTRP